MSRDILHRLRTELWQPPRAHGEIQRDRTVGHLELFYDLVVVVLVAQAADTLAAHLTARGLAQFAVVFTIVWIAWFNGTFLHELHGREDVRSRNSFLAQILVLIPLSAYVPRAGDVHGRAFAVTAALLFLLIAFLWWRVSRADTPEFARPTLLYVAATLSLAVGLAASAPLSADARLILWATLAVLYLFSVVLVFSAVPGQFDRTVAVTDALIERFGLLVIIVLGESVTGVVSGLMTDPTNAHKLAVAVVAVLVGFGAWWTYFDFVGRRQPRNTRSGTIGWLFGHLPVSAAIAAMGATMPTLVGHATRHRAAPFPTWVLCGGVVAVLVFTVVLMVSLQDWHRAAALLHPVAVANLVAAIVAGCLGFIRPSPLVLCILLVLTFGGPWVFAVLRRAALEVKASERPAAMSDGTAGP
ncbi:MAG TPA: low temperature requirement protein A [Jatrophihabitans sp.]|nr:low temperature requirement protein A [Jatrophihabitans sp.]